MTAIYEVAHGDEDEHIYTEAEPVTSTGNVDDKGDDSTGITNSLKYAKIGFLIFIALLITAGVGLLVYMLHINQSDVECNPPNVSALIRADTVKQSYKRGEEISGLTCAAGELLVGSRSLVCLEDGTWNDTATCLQIECKTPNVTGLIPNEKLKQSYQPHEEISNLTCAVGEKLDGESNLVCQEDGTWNGQATCVQIECNPPNVSALIRADTVKQSYKRGEEISGLTCAAGELLVGSRSLVCLEDGTWNDTATCLQIECKTPNVTGLIPNEKLKQSYQPHEEISNLTCAVGEKLDGESNLVCQEDGTWNGQATCVQIECNPPNVSALIRADTVKQSYKRGEEISGLTCAAGELLVGSRSLVCLEDGTWNDTATCLQIECKTPNVTGLIPNEKLKQSYQPHEEISNLTCAVGEKLDGESNLVCQEDGTWNGQATCVQIECNPPNVSALIRADTVKQSYKRGEEISGLTCAAGELLVGSRSLVCLEDGTWNDTATCLQKCRFGEQLCQYGSTCLTNGSDYSCVCPPGFTGRNCDIGLDCSSFSDANMTGKNSDIYQLWMPQHHSAESVVCDVTTDGGGWLVIQRRFNGSVSFYRNFSEYEHGFGELSGEFWMGLHAVHDLMTCGNSTWEVRFDLEDAEGLTGYRTYKQFRLASPPYYTLHIGQSTGTANRKKDEDYGFTYNNGRDFSTYDYGRNTDCGTRYRGGWWYNYCTNVNINGEYGHPPGIKSSFTYGFGGMIYRSFDKRRTLKSTEMKIRRVSGSSC